VAGDSPGYSWDAGTVDPQGKAGENGQPGGWLCKSSLQETVGYAGGKLPAGVANDRVTCRSPVSVVCGLKGEHCGCSSLLPSCRVCSWTMEWRLNVQSGLQDPWNNTLGILQPV